MHRTQINLEQWQVEALRTRAAARGCSMGALIREIVGEYLAPDRSARRAKLAAITGIVAGPGDVARSVDDVLYGPLRSDGGADEVDS